MKIKLAEDVLVDIFPNDDNCIGCHRIKCPVSVDFCLDDCEISKRGLDGSYYPIDDVEDLIIM